MNKVLDLQARKRCRSLQNRTYTELLKGYESNGVVNDKATTAEQRSGKGGALMQDPSAGLKYSGSYSASYVRRKEQIEHYRLISESSEPLAKKRRR